LTDELDDFVFDEIEKQEIKELLEKKEGILIDMKDINGDFVEDMNADKEFLEALLYEWEQVDYDPKLDVFVEKLAKLQQEQKERKIVVFSQYASTIDYLEKKLKGTFRTLKVT